MHSIRTAEDTTFEVMDGKQINGHLFDHEIWGIYPV